MNDRRPRTKTISAGEVILLSLKNEDRPCDKIMAILLNPIKVKNDAIVGSLELAYSIVVEKGQFLGHGNRKLRDGDVIEQDLRRHHGGEGQRCKGKVFREGDGVEPERKGGQK